MTTENFPPAAVALTAEAIEAHAHRTAWRYRKSTDPYHSDTYTFNRHTLLDFARRLGVVADEGTTTAFAPAEEVRGNGHIPEHLVLAVDRWFAENTGLGGCSDADVAALAALFWGVHFDGGRESVEDALAVVESFGPGIQGLNDTFARQILLADEVRRLRGIYQSAVKGRSDMRQALIDTRALLGDERDRLDWLDQMVRTQGAVWALPCGRDMSFVQIRSLDCVNFPTVTGGVRAAIDAARADQAQGGANG